MADVSEQAGRYQRSFPAMVGAMIVVVGVIAAFVVFRALNRDEVEIEPESVDYLATVEALQQGGGTPVAYPPSLPEGWIATAAAFNADGIWGISLLSGDDQFVGVRQARNVGGDDPERTLDDLVTTYVDAEAEEGDAVTLDSALSPEWRSFSDAGGDRALAAVTDAGVVLVVGTAPEDQIRDLTASLVTDDLS
jgi:hypothetical protein